MAAFARCVQQCLGPAAAQPAPVPQKHERPSFVPATLPIALKQHAPSDEDGTAAGELPPHAPSMAALREGPACCTPVVSAPPLWGPPL